MRPRTNLLLVAGAITALGVLAAALGYRAGRPQDADARRSTFLTSPQGARAWADALARLGVRVTRFRRRTPELPATGPRAIVAILDPARPLSAFDAQTLVFHARAGGPVLAAGARSNALFRCYHVAVAARFGARADVMGDSVPVDGIFDTVPAPPAAVGRAALRQPACRAGAFSLDTLLLADAAPVVLRVNPDSGASLLLVAAGNLFANRQVRETRAGEFTLGLVAGHYDSVLVDEYHQGFGPGGSMLASARDRLFGQPFGWLVLQLIAVGVLAMIAAGIRFGPVRHVIVRRRRSVLEHVRALATALAAAHGRRVAVNLVVQGLRRRLARGTVADRRSTGAWLTSVAARTRTPRGRRAADALIALTSDATHEPSVRDAALAVEDVWQDLSP